MEAFEIAGEFDFPVPFGSEEVDADVAHDLGFFTGGEVIRDLDSLFVFESKSFGVLCPVFRLLFLCFLLGVSVITGFSPFRLHSCLNVI